MLPFSDAVDAPNENRVNVCDSDPPPTAKKTVDTPLSPSETPHWSILSEVVTYLASPSPGLEITPIQSESADSSGSTNTETDPLPLRDPWKPARMNCISAPMMVLHLSYRPQLNMMKQLT